MVFKTSKNACQYIADRLGVVIVAKAESGGWLELQGLSGMHITKIRGYDDMYRDLVVRWERLFEKPAPIVLWR